jgi:formylglycine-generating enzyme required for sulfatase activity
MGSPESEWGHAPVAEVQVAVTLTRPFMIQQAEATQGDWMAAGLPNPNADAADAGACVGDAQCPVGNVTWFEAAAYANLLSERHDPPLAPCYRLVSCAGALGEGLHCSTAESTSPTVYECEGFRFPTEAEWEYAARAGTTTAYYSGALVEYGDYVRNFSNCNADPNLERIGWYCFNSGGAAHPGKQLEPNAWGLYDMAGNLNEWNSDWFDGASATSPSDPGGTVETRDWRNIRGGAYFGWASLCRMANTSERQWGYRHPSTGFRLVRTLLR